MGFGDAWQCVSTFTCWYQASFEASALVLGFRTLLEGAKGVAKGDTDRTGFGEASRYVSTFTCWYRGSFEAFGLVLGFRTL